MAATLRGQGANLALATWVFAINFWAWNLIGPLSATYTKAMSLTSTQTALLVATPILVGSRRPDPGRRAHRPLRRSQDVHA